MLVLVFVANVEHRLSAGKAMWSASSMLSLQQNTHTQSVCARPRGRQGKLKKAPQVMAIGPPNTGLGAGSGQTQHKTRHRFVRPRENSQE